MCSRAHILAPLSCFAPPHSDSFLLNLTDGGRSYPSLTDLLLQCRPFMFLYPGISKEHVLGPGAAAASAAAAAAAAQQQQQGEDSPAAHGHGHGGHGHGHGHGHPPHHHPPSLHTHNLSGSGGGGRGENLKFQQFPNNASGGGVGLFSPPAPGQHGGNPLHSGGFGSSGGGSGGGMGMPPMGSHSFSVGSAGVGSGPSPNQSPAPGPPRLVHPQSFPGNMHQLAAALLPGSNPNAEGQPALPIPSQAQQQQQQPQASPPRGPSPVVAQQEGVPSVPGGM